MEEEMSCETCLHQGQVRGFARNLCHECIWYERSERYKEAQAICKKEEKMIKYVLKDKEVKKDAPVVVWLELINGEPTVMAEKSGGGSYNIVTLEEDGILYRWGGIPKNLGFTLKDGMVETRT